MRSDPLFAPEGSAKLISQARTWLVLLLLTLIAACADCAVSRLPSQASIPQTLPTTSTVRIFVIVHGWHSGVALPTAMLAAPMLPEAADFPRADYLEFGWGDRDYYRGKRGAWVILKAALGRKPGVLHVASCIGRIESCFPYSQILSLDVSEPGMRRLMGTLSGSFRRGGTAKAVPLGPGLYGDSRFYPSRDRFDLFRTCNAWTAGLIRDAGEPIDPASSLTATALLKQLEPYATWVQARR